MKTTQNRGLTFFRTAGLLAVLVALLLPASASAADSIYWSREDGSNSIRFGPLSGDNGGSTPAQTLFDDGGAPCGIAANPAAGKIYWANWNTGEIRVANLDGTLGSASTLFAEPGNVCGVAVDPAAGKIYWANFSTNEIRVGNLNGTGTPSTLFTDPGGSAPSGVAIDPANNKIYWTNQFSDEVRAGNLDGSGFAQSLFSGEDNPIGVAADPAAGKIYWTDLNAGTVRVGPLGGSTVGAAQTLFNSSTPSGPAIDPTTNKIYWTSWTSGLGIRVGNLRRHGDRLDPVRRRGRIALRRAGEGACEHRASGDLRRSQGGQGTHLPERDVGARPARGVPVQGPGQLRQLSVAEGWVDHRHRSDVHAHLAGDYTCTVTATNQAGSILSQTSAVKKVKAH